MQRSKFDFELRSVRSRRVSNVVSGPVTFGQIPHEHWYQPDWVDEEKAKAGRDKMVKNNIIYGGSVSYVVYWTITYGVLADIMHTLDIETCVALIPGYVEHLFRLLHSAHASAKFFYRHPLVLKYRWYWRVE